MIERCVYTQTTSPAVASAIARKVAGETPGVDVIMHDPGSSLVGKLPGGFLPQRRIVIAPHGTVEDKKGEDSKKRNSRERESVNSLVEVTNKSDSPITLLVSGTRKPYPSVAKLDNLTIVDATFKSRESVKETLDFFGISGGKGVVAAVHSGDSNSIMELALTSLSEGDTLTEDMVAAFSPVPERKLWELSRVVFEGDSSQLETLFDSFEEHRVDWTWVVAFMSKQAHIMIAGLSAESRDVKNTLLAMGVNERAVYPVSKSLPDWGTKEQVLAAKTAAWADYLVKGGMSSALGGNKAVAEIMCRRLTDLSGRRGNAKRAPRGRKKAARSRG